MAGALVVNSVRVGSTPIRQFSSFTLTQALAAHHQFSVVCPYETVEGLQGSLFARSRNLIGETITVNLQDADNLNVPLLFSGVVTQVESAKFAGHMGDVVISGYCPTILLDNGPHCNTWEKKALNNIAQDVLGHFSDSVKSPVVNAAYGETFAYTVQYKETAWEFLARLAATYGEWFFYNGQTLVFGQPKGKTVSLVFGRDLSRFNIALELRPPNFQQMARDYVNDQLYDTTPAGIEGKAGLNDIGNFLYAKSKSFFSTQPKYWNNRFVTNKKQLEDNTNFKAAAQSSNMVRFYGSSTHQGVQLGNKVSVRGQNVNLSSDEAYGDYSVIEVTHHFDSQGQYSNDFVAIPSTIKIPPITTVAEPSIETQSAFVTDNHDPQGMGRVRVKLHWMKGSQKTPWIRVTSPHGGGGKGMYFIPEVGEEVMVGFEGDSPVKPYVIGTVYHGKADSTFGNGGNDVKALQTGSGNKLVMNDAEGSVHLTDKGPADLKFDGQGNAILDVTKAITLKGGEKIELLCGASSITLLKDGTIVINGKEIFTDGQVSVAVTSGEASGIVIQPSTLEAGSSSVTVSGTSEVSVGGPKVGIGGGAEVNVSSGKISMN